MFFHDWSYHQHEVSGWHGNVQTEVQAYKCRHCGTVKQMPAFLDCKPPTAGCLVEKAPTVEIPHAVNPYEEKGDDHDERPLRQNGKNHR